MALFTDDELKNLVKFKTVTTDSGSVSKGSVEEAIKADQYEAAKEAAASGKPALRMFKTVPPGTV